MIWKFAFGAGPVISQNYIVPATVLADFAWPPEGPAALLSTGFHTDHTQWPAGVIFVETGIFTYKTQKMRFSRPR
jgi:hypothetical protein